MLNDDQKLAFKKLIKQKYKVDVDPSQIIKLEPTSLECEIDFTCENDGDESDMKLRGSDKSLNKFPLKVSFKLTKVEKLCFEKHLIDHQHVSFDCSISTYFQPTNQSFVENNKDIKFDKLKLSKSSIFEAKFQLEYKDGKLFSY